MKLAQGCVTVLINVHHLPPTVTTLSSLAVKMHDGMWEQWALKRLNLSGYERKKARENACGNGVCNQHHMRATADCAGMCLRVYKSGWRCSLNDVAYSWKPAHAVIRVA
jgi:hypothetical protein